MSENEKIENNESSGSPETTPRPSIAGWEIALLIAVVLLAGVIRIWGLGEKSFWVDELRAVELSTRNLSQTIADCRDGHEPPLRYIITHYLAVLHPREFWTRLPSFLFAVATVPLLWVLARRLFGAATGLVAAFLLALSPWHILHSQDVRMYAVTMFFWVLSLILLFMIFDRPEKPLPWLGLAVAHAAGFYLSYITLFTLVGELLVLVGVIVLRRVRDPKAFSGKAYGAGVLIFAGFFGFLLAFWMHPFLDLFDRYLGTQLTARPVGIEAVRPMHWMGWPAEFDASFFAKLFDRLLLPGTIMKIGIRPETMFELRWYWIAPIVVVFGHILFWRRCRPLFWISVLSFLIALVAILFSAMRYFVAPRYLFHVLIFAVLATSLVVTAAGESVVKRLPGRWSQPAVLGLSALFVIGWMVAAGPTVWLLIRVERQDWKGACQYLAEHVTPPVPAESNENGEPVKSTQPGDVVITGAWGSHLAVNYYAAGALAKVPVRPGLTARSTEDAIEAAPARAWYVTWGPMDETVLLVVRSHMEEVATFPGYRGTIRVYTERSGTP